MEGYIIINEKCNVWLSAHETYEDAKELIDRINTKVPKLNMENYTIKKCTTSQDWDVYSTAMFDKGREDLSIKGMDECMRLMKLEEN